jgi:hypothetical protein
MFAAINARPVYAFSGSLWLSQLMSESLHSRFRLSARFTRDSAWLQSFKLIYAVSLFINILGSVEVLSALEGPSLKRRIFGE